MNIKQVRYFVAVFQSGSLSAAAKEQYVTVQAVSKAIADLERELKNELFVRESRGVHPTLFGKAFYVKAEPVLRSFDELEAFAHRRRSAESPLFAVGAVRVSALWIRASMRQHCIVRLQELGHRNLYTA